MLILSVEGYCSISGSVTWFQLLCETFTIQLVSDLLKWVALAPRCAWSLMMSLSWWQSRRKLSMKSALFGKLAQCWCRLTWLAWRTSLHWQELRPQLTRRNIGGSDVMNWCSPWHVPPPPRGTRKLPLHVEIPNRPFSGPPLIQFWWFNSAQ